MATYGPSGYQEFLNMNTTLLKDAERVVRVTMIVILLTAGTSKFFSHGDLARHFWSRSKVVKSHRGDLNHAKETI